MFNRRQIVKYSTVFGVEKAIDPKDMLVIDKVTWAKILARLNYLARYKEDYEIDQVLNDWFRTTNNDYKTEALKKIKDNYWALGFMPKDLGILSMWTNLYMLDQMLKADCNDLQTMSEGESEIKLFEIYLILNETFAKGSNQLNINLGNELYSTVRTWYPRAMVTTLIKYHDFTHFKAVHMLVVNYIKAVFCFRFLEEEGHQPLLQLFLDQYGMSCWQEFLDHIMPMMNSVTMKGDGSGLFYLSISNDDNQTKKIIFLDRFALTDTATYPESIDFLHAKSNPLFKTEPSRYLILDSVLAVNRIYNSLFFELKTLAENNKLLHKGYDAFFSFYTFEYIEKYLAYKLLDSIFNHNPCYNISGQDIKARFNVDLEPDYYVRDANNVLLFEIKGSILTGQSKQSFQYSELEKEIKKKYYRDEKTEQKKAVLQLVDRTRIILQGLAKYDVVADTRSLEIFPILIVSEIAMTTPGMNFILNEWFRHALKCDDFLKESLSQIHDLVIIDLDTLIMQSDRLGEKVSLVEECIREYEIYTADPETKMSSLNYTREQKEEMTSRASQSFSNFINGKFPVQTPKLFMEFGRAQVAHRLYRTKFNSNN